jgi:hypothetical protein
MELVRRKILPQGLPGQAIDYALKRWTALSQFITDGTLEAHLENAIGCSLGIPTPANAAP